MGSLPSRGAWIEMQSSFAATTRAYMSLPSRGAWIEIGCSVHPYPCTASLPSRGAWIEIRETLSSVLYLLRRSPRGERGLKCSAAHAFQAVGQRRSPRGERGLK